MRRRIITRLLWFLPALFVVSLLVFFINASDKYAGNFQDSILENSSSGDNIQREKEKQFPVFYFSVTSLSEPDSIWKMTSEEQRAIKSSWKNFIPVVHFYSDNQYRRWLFGNSVTNSKGILRGDFGVSKETGLPISEMLYPRFIRSFILVFISMLLAFIISIPLSVYLVLNEGKIIAQIINGVLLIFYIIPIFWLAILLLMLFANPRALSVFPLSGWPESGEGFLSYIHHLFLPVMCYTLGDIAYFTRALETNLHEVLHKEFLLTARAKGFDKTQSLIKHALPHAIIPVLTVLGYLFPMAVGGSVIVENIFGIPGMSQALYHAALTKDVPVLAAISTVSCLLTLLGFLLTEILQAFIDPRLRQTSPLS